MDLRDVEIHLRGTIKGTVLFMEDMSEHTSWRIGGPADIMVVPADEDDIRNCQQYAAKTGIPLTIIGNGTNLLVRDKGIRGIVLKIARGFNNIVINGSSLTAEAGALLPIAARRAAEAGLSGLEFAAGIPASVGGAVIMNAGAHAKSLHEVIREVKVLTPEGDISTLTRDEVGFGYRESNLKENGSVVLSAEFALEPGDPSEIKLKIESNLTKRRKSQPLEYPNAGSIFANPPGQWAGWLIEQAGCKGMRSGNAMVSEKHANFIVNLGSATAKDVLSLITSVRELVAKKFDIELKLEVRVIGE